MVHPDYQYTPKLIPAMAAWSAAACIRACLARASWAAARWLAACRCGATSPIAFSRSSATSCSAPRCPSSTPATAPSRASCSRRCRSRRTRTTSSSTTRCWRRRCGWDFRSAKSRAPRATRPTPRQSLSCAASATVSAAWERRRSSGWRSGAWSRSDRFPVDKHLAYSTWRQRAN